MIVYLTMEAGSMIHTLEVPAFPEPLLQMCRVISDVHELVIEVAVTGNVAIAKLAIDVDPAIGNKEAAYKALEQMLEIHADLLPQFHS